MDFVTDYATIRKRVDRELSKEGVVVGVRRLGVESFRIIRRTRGGVVMGLCRGS